MENKFETEFISEIIEREPFVDSPAQNFFAKWCSANGSITPLFLSREQWKEIEPPALLGKNESGDRILFLPVDLHLWEVVDIVREIDSATFSEQPELSGQRADQINELGITFEKAGIYIKQYLPEIEEGKAIAKEIADKFYKYGRSLQERRKNKDNIPRKTRITDEDKHMLDEWFLGKEALQRRMTRLGEKPSEEQVDERRRELLGVYFRALAREVETTKKELPWDSVEGPIQHLKGITRKQIERAIVTPERELRSAIFRGGVKELAAEMREFGWKEAMQKKPSQEALGLDFAVEYPKLYEKLGIAQHKKDLAQIRETGDISRISQKELELAKLVQRAVSSFPYQKDDGYLPAGIMETQYMNCVGSSLLGGAFLDELGIRYLVADLPEHSATFLITSDEKVYWQDFTPPGDSNINYKEITPDMLEGKVDIVAFANSPDDNNIFVEFKAWRRMGNGEKLKLSLYKPETGLQAQILYNLGISLIRSGYPKEAVEAYKQAIDICPGRAYTYAGLGSILSLCDRHAEALAMFKESIALDPEYSFSYAGLGEELHFFGRPQEALDAYDKAISLDPNNSIAFLGIGETLVDIGRNDGAIRAFLKFIELWDGDSAVVEKVRKKIKDIERFS